MLHHLPTAVGLAAVLCLSACRSDSANTNWNNGPTSKADAASPDAGVMPEVRGQDATSAIVDLLAVESSLDETRLVGEPPAADRPGADALADATPTETTVLDGPASDGRGEAGCTGWTTLVHLSPDQAYRLLTTSDPIVINVHGPGADIPGVDVYIPYNQVDEIEDYLKHDRCADVLLTCLGGGMSTSAGNELVRRGYLRIRNMAGGVAAWKAAGYPMPKDGGT